MTTNEEQKEVIIPIKRYEAPQSFIDTLVSVTLVKPESFKYTREVLTRIGIKARSEPRLCQSCHILKKRDKYYIMHFKELFLLDGKTANFSEDDLARRNTIAFLLSEWNLVSIDDPAKIESPRMSLSSIDIIPHSKKNEWILESKYQIGSKRQVHDAP